jgi:23S rRNA (cytidine1920-2'-O)/16S rRNA (cytidine1409-2'-O)-methyltransferase
VTTRADVSLVQRGLFESRAKARAAIEAGLVKANGVVVAKASEALAEDVVIEAQAAHPWVGRGALKLDHALTLWPITVEGRTVLDVGASTGGFTEVGLARGAAKVFAVDVGRGQLHQRLKADSRVIELSGQDARSLTADQISTPPDLVVCDASFIGLAKVLPAALDLAGPDADLVALIKPQFEAGPDKVGKGGVVKDEAVRAKAVADVSAWLVSIGWTIEDVTESPITGGDGNIEYLVWASKKGRSAN